MGAFQEISIHHLSDNQQKKANIIMEERVRYVWNSKKKNYGGKTERECARVKGGMENQIYIYIYIFQTKQVQWQPIIDLYRNLVSSQRKYRNLSLWLPWHLYTPYTFPRIWLYDGIYSWGTPQRHWYEDKNAPTVDELVISFINS